MLCKEPTPQKRCRPAHHFMLTCSNPQHASLHSTITPSNILSMLHTMAMPMRVPPLHAPLPLDRAIRARSPISDRTQDGGTKVAKTERFAVGTADERALLGAGDAAGRGVVRLWPPDDLAVGAHRAGRDGLHDGGAEVAEAVGLAVFAADERALLFAGVAGRAAA